MKNDNAVRVVLDSNVLLSALVFGGKPREVLEWLIDNGTIIISTQIITEMRRIVSIKFPDFITELHRLEKLLDRDALRVQIGHLQVSLSRDPNDNAIIETALVGACQHLITGDKDLLVIGTYKNIIILSPADFLTTITK